MEALTSGDGNLVHGAMRVLTGMKNCTLIKFVQGEGTAVCAGKRKPCNPPQGCSLAAPGGPWRPTFAHRQLRNLSFFMKSICWAPWISQFQSTGLTLQFFLEHSLAPNLFKTCSLPGL